MGTFETLVETMQTTKTIEAALTKAFEQVRPRFEEVLKARYKRQVEADWKALTNYVEAPPEKLNSYKPNQYFSLPHILASTQYILVPEPVIQEMHTLYKLHTPETQERIKAIFATGQLKPDYVRGDKSALRTAKEAEATFVSKQGQKIQSAIGATRSIESIEVSLTLKDVLVVGTLKVSSGADSFTAAVSLKTNFRYGANAANGHLTVYYQYPTIFQNIELDGQKHRTQSEAWMNLNFAKAPPPPSREAVARMKADAKIAAWRAEAEAKPARIKKGVDPKIVAHAQALTAAMGGVLKSIDDSYIRIGVDKTSTHELDYDYGLRGMNVDQFFADFIRNLKSGMKRYAAQQDALDAQVKDEIFPFAKEVEKIVHGVLDRRRVDAQGARVTLGAGGKQPFSRGKIVVLPGPATGPDWKIRVQATIDELRAAFGS